jgi:hypothetical protein
MARTARLRAPDCALAGQVEPWPSGLSWVQADGRGAWPARQLVMRADQLTVGSGGSEE